MELNKELILSLVISKYGSLVFQQKEDNSSIPITKEFYKNYKSNNKDVFYFNKQLRRILIGNEEKGSFENWLIKEIESYKPTKTINEDNEIKEAVKANQDLKVKEH